MRDGRCLATRLSTLDFTRVAGGQANHTSRSRQDFLRNNPLRRDAFEPGHLAVSLFGQPVLEFVRTGGRSGGGEPAIIEPQFPRPLSDLFFHGVVSNCTKLKGGAGLWPA